MSSPKIDVQSDCKSNGAPLRHASSQGLFEYWDALRGARPAPERHEVDLIEIKPILSNVFFAERNPGNFAMFQFAGSRINALHGLDLQGHSMIGVWCASSAGEFIKAIERLTSHGVPVAISSVGLFRNRGETEIETVILPLSHGSGFGRIMGTHLNLGMSQGYWNGPLAACRITAVRPLFSERGSAEIGNINVERIPDVFTNVVPIAPAAHGGRKVGRLTVIDGGCA